jgi:deoxycytidylate deaminase
MIINANIGAVYFDEGYADELSDQMLQEAGVKLFKWRYPEEGGE